MTKTILIHLDSSCCSDNDDICKKRLKEQMNKLYAVIIISFNFYDSSGISAFYYLLTSTKIKLKKGIITQDLDTICTIFIYRSNSLK